MFRCKLQLPLKMKCRIPEALLIDVLSVTKAEVIDRRDVLDEV